MCTVTFIPRREGYALGMNRDEKLTRITALPPALHQMAGRNALFPSEPGGGTWIGINDAGVCFALINWYAIPARASGKTLSRGDVVKGLLATNNLEFAQAAALKLPLRRLNPFRLIGIYPQTRNAIEWRWNLKRLERVEYPWIANTWISSGFDEPGAQITRGKVFSQSSLQKSAGGLDWLRRIHRSHKPERGPYSTCMHREDAATVSYTEAVVTPSLAVMRYKNGSPCCGSPLSVHQLPLNI
ncbi:MAG: hypothetical protein JWR26_2622 [Pedosphaera sp.]|nr:hypothetical protein [Pedosphaera sp.]